VDILVNAAGKTKRTPTAVVDEREWADIMDTNLTGILRACQSFYEPLKASGRGRIVNIASVIGLIGNAGQANYAASKAGLIGFTKSVAKEFGSRGVTCNAVAPGFIETDMTASLDAKLRDALLGQIPLGGFGRTTDIAEATLYLAGPGGRYVTGQVLTVDGGMVM